VRVGNSAVVQSVYKCLFVGLKEGAINPESRERLWGLLAYMTMCRCSKLFRDHATQKRDFRRDVPSEDGPDGLAEHEPTSDEIAAFLETITQNLEEFDEREQRIVKLGLLGLSDQEIAEQIGCLEYVVVVILDRFGRHLAELARRIDHKE
jgi:RNA polymerase sigma factor (sigma-70 family)